MENINDSMRNCISDIIIKKSLTKFYTSISILWGKIVKKCELDTVFLKELQELKEAIDEMEPYKNISVVCQETDYDYDESDYQYCRHELRKFLYRKEFFNSTYLLETETHSPQYTWWTDEDGFVNPVEELVHGLMEIDPSEKSARVIQ